MIDNLYQNRFLIGLRGVVAILFGVLAFVWPASAALALVYLFSGYVFVDGIITIASALRHRETNDRWWLTLLEGIVDIAAGVVAFLYPGLASITLLFLVAVWAMITGVLEIAAAIRLRREIDNEWSLGLAGVVSIALGVVMIINPGAGLVGMVWAIALYAVLFGILMLVLAFRARRVGTRTTGGSQIYP